MELSEIILRGLYLVILFGLLNMVLRSTTPLSGNPLLTISFFGAVLILYTTFDYVYDFLLNNELIFQIKNSENEDSNNNKELRSSRTEISNEVNVNNKKNVYDSNKVNHTHKYIVNKVFE